MTKKEGGNSQPVMENYNVLLGNTLTVGNATPLTTNNIVSFSTIVQSSHDNGQGGVVYVGNQHRQDFELQPGETVTIPCGASLIYVRGSDANQIVNWLAGG
jgi:hypothetical protein